GDHRAIDGTYSVQQPLIAPFRRGRSALEVLAIAAGIRGWRGYRLVRGTLQETIGASGFERAWRQSLHEGIVTSIPPRSPQPIRLNEGPLAESLRTAPHAENGWEVSFIPSYQVHDGR